MLLLSLVDAVDSVSVLMLVMTMMLLLSFPTSKQTTSPHKKLLSQTNSKLVELASEMRQHSGTSVSELKRKYNHLVPSNERVLGLAETEKNMSLSEVRWGAGEITTSAPSQPKDERHNKARPSNPCVDLPTRPLRLADHLHAHPSTGRHAWRLHQCAYTIPFLLDFSPPPSLVSPLLRTFSGFQVPASLRHTYLSHPGVREGVADPGLDTLLAGCAGAVLSVCMVACFDGGAFVYEL